MKGSLTYTWIISTTAILGLSLSCNDINGVTANWVVRDDSDTDSIVIPFQVPFYMIDLGHGNDNSTTTTTNDNHDVAMADDQEPINSERIFQSPMDPSWEYTKDACWNIPYRFQILVEQQSGHVMLLATPTTTGTTQNRRENPQDQVPCFSLVIHSIQDDVEDAKWIAVIHTIPPEYKTTQDIVTLIDGTTSTPTSIVSYDLGPTTTHRTLGTTTTALAKVTFGDDDIIVAKSDGHYYYKNTNSDNDVVPTNCCTYLLELAKALQLPIDSSNPNWLSFVVMNIKDSKFVPQQFKTVTKSIDTRWIQRIWPWGGEGRRGRVGGSTGENVSFNDNYHKNSRRNNRNLRHPPDVSIPTKLLDTNSQFLYQLGQFMLEQHFGDATTS